MNQRGGEHWDVTKPDGKEYRNVYPADAPTIKCKEGQVVLIATPLIFFSSLDEGLFFAWLGKIACVESCQGIGEELRIVIKSNQISFEEFCNLRGIFKRYGFNNPSQLDVFIDTKTQEKF